MGSHEVKTWLGKPESNRLEYKDAEALKHPESIARAVVAMLNDKGGHVIVGVGDDGVLRGVADAPRARDRLQQLLDDRIEPRAGIRVAVVSIPPHGEVLEVSVEGDAAPYVEHHQGRLGYWQRSGARTVPGTLADLVRALDKAKGEALATAPARPWTNGLQPEHPTLVLETTLALADDERWKKRELEDLWGALSAKRSQFGRQFGWTVVPMAEPGSEQYDTATGLTIGRAPHGRSLRLERGGAIRFEAYEGMLRMPQLANMPMPPSPRTLNPYMVVEGAASFTRLVSEVVTEAEHRGKTIPPTLVLTAGLWSLEGWHLPPRSFVESLLVHSGRAQAATIRVGAVAAIHRTSREALSTDLAARRLVGNLYEELGLSDTEVPFWDEARQDFLFG